MNEGLKGEIWRLLALLLLLFLITEISGHGAWVFAVGLAGYSTWHLYQMSLLERWMSNRGDDPPPQLAGIWQEIAENIARLKQRARKRKKRMSRLLKRFYTTLEAMPYAAVVLGAERQIEWSNSTARDLLGTLAGGDLGRHFDTVVAAPDLLEYLDRGDFDEPLHLPSPVNELIELEVQVVPFGNRQILLTARDITQMKRLQTVRRDFIANVSHELRTPLTVITGYLEMLAADEELSGANREALSASNRQAERMQRIVADLLTLSRLEMADLSDTKENPVYVGRLLEALQQDARRLSGERGHEIRLISDIALGLVGHETELLSAFSNLVYNAVLHTPDGTKIDIFWGRDGDGARLVVADQGPGISPEHLPRLTERFYRVDKGRSRERGGTGLGLSIVKHVIARHEGQIDIESELGSGTRFVCHFPAQRVLDLSQEQSEPAPEAGA